ncbi:MAG: TrmH family RNA methyltransferase [Planctomycetota bacterium]
MSGKSRKTLLNLVGLDIEGPWNVPLLQNAAEISGASLEFYRSELSSDHSAAAAASVISIEELLSRYDCVLACETGKKGRSVYEFPAPRGRTALVVGNELNGICGEFLKKVSQVVSIPMFGSGMTSVNVAVAAAIALYVLEGDLARKGIRTSRGTSKDVDVFLEAPGDPSELGSLLRSVWAFGWRKVYLCDHHGVWFTSDRRTIMAGRAAARREANPLVITSDEQMNIERYDSIILCDGERSGTALSRLVLPRRGRLLIAYGQQCPSSLSNAEFERVFVDHKSSRTTPCYRHMGSILLSVLSQMLHGTKRG